MARCRTCGGYQDDGEGGICPHCGANDCFMAEVPGPLLCGNTGREVVDCSCAPHPPTLAELEDIFRS